MGICLPPGMGICAGMPFCIVVALAVGAGDIIGCAAGWPAANAREPESSIPATDAARMAFASFMIFLFSSIASRALSPILNHADRDFREESVKTLWLRPKFEAALVWRLLHSLSRPPACYRFLVRLHEVNLTTNSTTNSAKTGEGTRRTAESHPIPPRLLLYVFTPFFEGSSGNPKKRISCMACKRSAVRPRYPPPSQIAVRYANSRRCSYLYAWLSRPRLCVNLI